MRTHFSPASCRGSYEVDDVKTGEEALEKLRDYHPDLVLLDMNMPGMGGLAVCREIRAGTGVGIIMLTVRNTEADKVEALDAGADDFINKPFSTPELLARIRAALRRVYPPAFPPQSLSPARVRVGKLVIDFAARTAFNAAVRTRPSSRPKELDLVRYPLSPPTPTKPWPTANFCKRSGGPRRYGDWGISRGLTCGCSSAICERKSNPIPTIPNS